MESSRSSVSGRIVTGHRGSEWKMEFPEPHRRLNWNLWGSALYTEKPGKRQAAQSKNIWWPHAPHTLKNENEGRFCESENLIPHFYHIAIVKLIVGWSSRKRNIDNSKEIKKLSWQLWARVWVGGKQGSWAQLKESRGVASDRDGGQKEG